jgi:hypothetical protein
MTNPGNSLRTRKEARLARLAGRAFARAEMSVRRPSRRTQQPKTLGERHERCRS